MKYTSRPAPTNVTDAIGAMIIVVGKGSGSGSKDVAGGGEGVGSGDWVGSGEGVAVG